MSIEEIFAESAFCSEHKIALSNIIMAYIEGHISKKHASIIVMFWFKLLGGSNMNADGIKNINFEFEELKLRIPDGHIMCRSDISFADDSKHSAVRDSMYVRLWAEIDKFSDDGLNFAAQVKDSRGLETPEYIKLSQNLGELTSLKIRPGSVITNAMLGERAVFFYTQTEPLWRETHALEFSDRADYLRDQLGLVHMKSDKPQVFLSFHPALTDSRPDCGRPTVIDAGGNPRFVAAMAMPGENLQWGRTANLSSVPDVAPGRPERVCGSFPAADRRGGEEIEFAFVGAPKIPRADYLGVLDAEFSVSLKAEFEGLGASLYEWTKFLVEGAS